MRSDGCTAPSRQASPSRAIRRGCRSPPTADTAAATAALSASVSPPPQSYSGLVGSFFRENQLFTLSATVAPGFSFAGWFGSNVNSIKNGKGADVVLAYPYDFNTGSTA